MKHPSETIKIKAVAGYVALLIVLLLTLAFIYKNVSILTRVEESNTLHTDSISILVNEKDDKLIELIQSLSQLNSNLYLTSEDLDKLMQAKSDHSLIQKSIVKKSDTIISKPKKKKFFKRVAEVFVPSKSDSTVQVRTSVETAIDSLYDEAKSDEVEKVFEDISRKIDQEKKALSVRKKRTKELKALNESITQRIDSLLSNYEEERVELLLEKIEEGNQSRQRAIKWIGIIAVIAVLLVILFSFLLLRDINRRNKYRKALELSNKRAADLLSAREKIMLTITHDIKAPLGTIMGYSELLEGTNLSVEQSNYLKSMSTATDHIYKLVYDLLDYHLLDLNKADIKLSTFNLHDFMWEIKQSFEPLFEKKGLSLQVDMSDSNLNQWVESDPVRVKQILNNLITNALKFTDQGGVEVYVNLGEDELVLKVRDSGSGMTSEEQKRIYNEFTRLASAQGKEGFGLGLSIVKKIITCMKGEISLVSTLNEGTEFTVRLPVVVKAEDSIAIESSVNFPKGTRILLLDDDQIQLRLTTTMLQKHGAEVVVCTRVNEVLDHLKQSQFNLLITDIQMPELSGFDLVKLLKNSNCEAFKVIPVLAVSARDQIEENKMKSLGFIGVLKKPCTVYEIIHKYLSFIDQEELPQSVVEKQKGARSFSANEHLNLSELSSFLQEDTAAIDDILNSFIQENKSFSQDLEAALTVENKEEISRLSHKIYPMVKIIGRKELAETLQFLDKKATFCTPQERTEAVSLVIEEMNNLNAAILEYISLKK